MIARHAIPTLALTALLMQTAPRSAHAASTIAARAEVSPSTLVVDRPAQLTISVDDVATIDRPSFQVPGARIEFRGRMSRDTVVNGRARTTSSLVYGIVASREGVLEIPALSIRTDHGVATTQPLRIEVSAPSVARPPATASSSAAARAFIKLELPSRTLYVGEAVPVKIRAYFRGGTAVTTQAPPTLTSDAFTLTHVADKPTQSEVVVNGEPYLLATWTAVLSPAKPMTEKVSVELPVELAYREPREQRRSLDDLLSRDPFAGFDPFADPFGADPFAGFDLDLESFFDTGTVQRKTTTLRARPRGVTVVEPPAKGRPPGFTGAVGSFELAMDPIAGPLRVGEPFTVTVRATGSGNFDRVSTSGLAESSDLKTYAVKSTVAPGTGALSATKTFTQTIVPTHAGTLEIPAVALAYFDPGTRAYGVAETPVVRVEVLPTSDAANAPPPVASNEQRLADSAAQRSTLRPMFRQRTFWFLPGALVVLTLLLVGAAWWRRSEWLANKRSSREIDRRVGRALDSLGRAADRGDDAEFFAHARHALQLRIGQRLGIAPEAVTAAEVAMHLGPEGARIQTILERADNITYARGHSTVESLGPWRKAVRDALARLEATS